MTKEQQLFLELATALAARFEHWHDASRYSDEACESPEKRETYRNDATLLDNFRKELAMAQATGGFLT